MINKDLRDGGLDNARNNLCLVRWEDHTSGAYGWTPVEKECEAHRAYLVESVGFLIFEDKNCLKLAITLNDSFEVSCVFTIIKSCIVERVDFKL